MELKDGRGMYQDRLCSIWKEADNTESINIFSCDVKKADETPTTIFFGFVLFVFVAYGKASRRTSLRFIKKNLRLLIHASKFREASKKSFSKLKTNGCGKLKIETHSKTEVHQ